MKLFGEAIQAFQKGWKRGDSSDDKQKIESQENQYTGSQVVIVKEEVSTQDKHMPWMKLENIEDQEVMK